MYYAVIFARVFCEMLLILADADGGGGAEVAACGDVGENLGGGVVTPSMYPGPGLDNRQGVMAMLYSSRMSAERSQVLSAVTLMFITVLLSVC